MTQPQQDQTLQGQLLGARWRKGGAGPKSKEMAKAKDTAVSAKDKDTAANAAWMAMSALTDDLLPPFHYTNNVPTLDDFLMFHLEDRNKSKSDMPNLLEVNDDESKGKEKGSKSDLVKILDSVDEAWMASKAPVASNNAVLSILNLQDLSDKKDNNALT
ncbi:hypothetical protein B0H34DRAFT_816995 [Crassisporium funariophilum]|nr:hypothetical protein B0H34DRAFT_816995 [Crassisporium funariophilum]